MEQTPLKTLAMAIAGILIALPAAQAAPPDSTLEKLAGKKQDQVQNEIGKGSEQGQLSREENSRKWWIFEDTEEEPPAPPPEEEPPTPPEEEPPPIPPEFLM